MTDPPNINSKLGEILELLWMAALDAKAMIEEEGLTEQDYINKQSHHFNKAKTALNQLLLEARIEELNRMYGESPQSWGSAYAAIENRIEELKALGAEGE